ncbi:glycoside hydrolase superfamily [Zychaea mexicana]|uniref:glycoside hydrolase superfamily n=1 Tax=Zychaea mexicana TaxID=64656 RepID=UPI0022FDCA1C|nr:glycoside hydrolase superfamily [Zychaea mexicana]KAI9494952.1 glycoside hydrolase superfamily [Zychaea mexicana]
MLAVCALADKVIVGYFPNWLYARWPASNIDFSVYTHIHYAFSILIKGDTPEWTDPSQVDTQLPALVKAAHASNAKVLISVGGWSGCLTFSTMAADPGQRKNFIQWNIDQIKKYGTDGVDIDWEYPGRQGAGCNAFDVANDANNYLVLLKELRTALDGLTGPRKELSFAAHVRPFVTPSGYMTDVSGFANIVDRINIMTYDINGAWNTTTGPNAPFNFEPGYGDADSYVSGIQGWLQAGAPKNKLVPGIAFYGRSATSTVDMSQSDSQYQGQVASKPPHGDSYDAFWQDPYCSKDPGSLSGVWRYGNLRSQGVLTTPTSAAPPWIRKWDKVTQTPWLFNPTDKTFISYDDPQSIGIKIDYALCQGLGGAMVWSVDEDTSSNELLNEVAKIRSG